MRPIGLLGLAAIALLLCLVPTALAERTHQVSVTFEDARTAVVTIATTGTSNDARAMRIAVDMDGDGVVRASELEEVNCWGAVGELPWYQLHLDHAQRPEVSRSCDGGGLVGSTSDGTSPVVRSTYRFRTPLQQAVSTAFVTNAAMGLTIAPPPGRGLEAVGWSYGGSIVSGQWRSDLPARYSNTEVVFPPPGMSLRSEWNVVNSGEGWRVDEPGALVMEQEIVATGLQAYVERTVYDADRDGVVEPGEVAEPLGDLRFMIIQPVTVNDAYVRPTPHSATLEGYLGPVSDVGTTSITLRVRYETPLPPDGFVLREPVPSIGTWILRDAGTRSATHRAGLMHVSELPDGGLTGRSSSWAPVEIAFSSTAGAPYTPPEAAPEMPAGDFVRTTGVALYPAAEGPGALMRWQITDVRTDAAARTFRSSLDSDSDNQVSDDEAAALEAGVRLVPAPEAWPFRLADRSPTSTRVLAVEFTGLVGGYNDPDPVRMVTTYEADYPVASGVLRADPLDYGARVAILAPHGSRIDPASAVGLEEVRAGADPSMLSAVPGTDPWSVTIIAPAAAPASTSTDAPSAPGGSGTTEAPASGAPASEAPAGETPASPGTTGGEAGAPAPEGGTTEGGTAAAAEGSAEAAPAPAGPPTSPEAAEFALAELLPETAPEPLADGTTDAAAPPTGATTTGPARTSTPTPATSRPPTATSPTPTTAGATGADEGGNATPGPALALVLVAAGVAALAGARARRGGK